MKNIEYIFEKIPHINHKKNKDLRKDKIIIKKKLFESSGIFYIIEHFNWKIEHKNFSKVKIDIKCEIIADDATLFIFESIIYYMIKKYDIDIQYRVLCNEKYVGYQLYKMSNLFEFDNAKINKEKFISNYENNFFVNMNRYKKVCINNANNLNGNYLSLLYDDVCNFLKNNGLKSDSYEALGETISEIVGNCFEHSDGDAILDIKIAKGYSGKRKCKFLSVTLISFTKKKFGEKLKEFIFENDSGYNISNNIVKEAYSIQKDKFNDNYTLDNFVMVSSFQEHVTTRKDSEGTGGRGLTLLINTLIDASLADYCYVRNGSTVMLLKKPYLELNGNNNIGFNDSNDYINQLPNNNIVYNSNRIFNGTIHNLAFILDGGINE